MPELKTRPTTASIAGFIKRQPDAQTRDDCRTLVSLMEQVTGESAVMWGPSIIGFGTYRLVYANGSEADWPIASFSPRKSGLTIYLMDVFERREDLMKRLGKHRTSKVCLHIKRLADVDMKVLKELIATEVRYLRERPVRRASMGRRSGKRSR